MTLAKLAVSLPSLGHHSDATPIFFRSAEPRFSCVKEVLTTVACLSAENLLFYPPKVGCLGCVCPMRHNFKFYQYSYKART